MAGLVKIDWSVWKYCTVREPRLAEFARRCPYPIVGSEDRIDIGAERIVIAL